jgi:DNA-binding SARP family transcriptional activator
MGPSQLIRTVGSGTRLLSKKLSAVGGVAMTPFKTHLFGRFSLQQDGRDIEALQSGKAKELLCYLVLHANRSHSREVLASQLWTNCTTAQSRKYFRQALWQLQQVVHGHSSHGQRALLQVDRESVRLDSQPILWVDTAAFEEAFASVRGIAGEQIDEQGAHNLRVAASLYKGELLEGWYQDWCLYHRERLNSMYLAMLDKLMGCCEVRRDFDGVLAFGELLLQQDPTREQAHYRLMRQHYLAGDRAGAVRQFQRCEAALEKELGVKPAKRTIELCDRIRTDQALTPPTAECEVASSSSQKPKISSFFSRLPAIRSLLLRVQQQLERDIREVDRILGANSNSSTLEKH